MSKSTISTNTKIALASTKPAKAVKYTFDMKATKDTLNKAIAQIASKGATLNKLAHETAVNALFHFSLHGDKTVLLPLANAVGSAMGNSRRAAFILWCTSYCPSLVWDDKGKDFMVLKSAEHKTRTVHADAKTKPFWAKFDRARDEPVAWNFREEFAKFLSRMQNGYKAAHGFEVQGRVAKGDITPKELRLLETLASDMGVKIDTATDDGSHKKNVTNAKAKPRKVAEPKAKAPAKPVLVKREEQPAKAA